MQHQLRLLGGVDLDDSLANRGDSSLGWEDGIRTTHLAALSNVIAARRRASGNTIAVAAISGSPPVPDMLGV